MPPTFLKSSITPNSYQAGDNLSPTYKGILAEVGRQLKLRRSVIVKRSFMITWPFLAIIAAGFIFNEFYSLDSLSGKEVQGVIILGGVLFVLSMVYTILVRFVFEIEKQIWIDSFFDKRELSHHQSWNIARKLFWPALSFRVKLWSKYYLAQIGAFAIGIVILVIAYANIFGGSDIVMELLVGSIVGFIVFIIGVSVYNYYVRTVLRYSYFIFLDSFGKDRSYQSMIEEMENLNNVSKSDSFRKSLIVNVGTDSVTALGNMTVGAITVGLSGLGEYGKTIGSMVNIFGKEVNRQVFDLGKVAAQYILYKYARKEFYGTEQEVNEAVYSLVEN